MTRAAQPVSLAEAVRMLAVDPELRPVAGCTDLMVNEPEERADMPAVLDVLRIPELVGICASESGLEIGAATPFTAIRHSRIVQERYPALAAAAAVVGGWQIQNRATIGGNIANASPAGDSLPALLALDATVVLASEAGEREVPYREFHIGYRETALAPGELISRIRLPMPAPGSRQVFRKVGTREAQAISKVVLAGYAEIEDGRFAKLRLGAGSVAATPIRLTAVEEALVGRAATPETAAEGGRIAAESVTPIDDVRSTAEYRSWVLARVLRRMLLELAGA